MTLNQLDWPEPEIIKPTLLPVLPLNAIIIPVPYRDWVLDVAERMQCPSDFVAVASIVVTAAIIGAGCAVRPKQNDDWQVVPNLWGGVVGRPGMLKTPAIAEVMKIINILEAESKQQYDANAANYYAESEFLKAEKEAIKSEMLKAHKQSLQKKIQQDEYDVMELKNKLAQLQDTSKPIWKRYKTNDATIKKLSALLAENPRGLLLFRDELMGLLSTWEQEGRESDCSFFLESWNGNGSITSDRLGRGTAHTKNVCLTLFGATQPAKLLRYLYQAVRGCDNDGFLQRFQLMIYPDEINEWKLIDRTPNNPAKQRAFSIIRKLSEIDFVRYGAKTSPDCNIPYFEFDNNSRELFYCWLTEHEKNIKTSDDHPILKEHLAKFRSLFPSLALIFFLIDIADGEQCTAISFDHVVSAIGWCGYLESHARRIYGMATNMSHHAAALLAKKIEEGKLKSGFTIRDVYRKDWSLLSSKEVIRNACDELIELGWLRIEIRQGNVGRPKQASFVINPKIKISKPVAENLEQMTGWGTDNTDEIITSIASVREVAVLGKSYSTTECLFAEN